MWPVCIVIVFYFLVHTESHCKTACPKPHSALRYCGDWGREEKRQVSELRYSTLYCSSPGERGRAVQIFSFECLKDGGVFVALSSQVPQMAQCTSNGKPFIWPWDCTCCTSRWFMEETSSDSLSRRCRACGCKDIMEERHKRAGKWVRGWGRGEEGCYFCVIPQDPLLLGLAVRKKPIQFEDGSR